MTDATVNAPEQSGATETPAPSMDETMSEVWDSLQEPEGPEPEPGQEPEEGAEAEGASEAETEPAEGEAETPEGQEGEDRFPAHWSADMQEKFAALPEDAQAAVREWDEAAYSRLHGRLSEQGRVISALRPIGDTLEQYRHTFESRGLEPQKAVESLLAAQDALDRDPVGALHQIAQVYGVDLAQVYGQKPQSEDHGRGDAPMDAQTAALQQHIAHLEQQLNAIRTETAQERQLRQAQEVQEAQGHISQWAQAKPHFEEVRQTMARLIEAGEAQSLEDAYDKAVWLNPETRKTMEAAKAKESAAKRAQEAEAAKKRQRVNVGKPGDHAPPKRSWEEDLEAVYDEVTGG